MLKIDDRDAAEQAASFLIGHGWDFESDGSAWLTFTDIVAAERLQCLFVIANRRIVSVRSRRSLPVSPMLVDHHRTTQRSARLLSRGHTRVMRR